MVNIIQVIIVPLVNEFYLLMVQLLCNLCSVNA